VKRAASFLPATWRVFDLSLGLMLWSRRTIFMVLVVAGPVALACLMRALTAIGLGSGPGRGPSDAMVFGLMMWLFYLRFIVPALAVFYGTALIADEVDDKTITYLFTRPVRRGAILLGKYLAYLVCTVLMVLPSLTLVFFLVIGRRDGSVAETFPVFAADLAVVAVGLATYGAVFAFIGAALPRPLLFGLFFVFGWEPTVLLLPGYLKRATIVYYLQAFVPNPLPPGPAGIFQGTVSEGPGRPIAAAALVLLLAALLVLAVRSVERREYVLEQ
jgi:ABC-2 type transport system permease protein